MGFLCCGKKKQQEYSKVDPADQDAELDQEECDRRAREFKGCPNVGKP